MDVSSAFGSIPVENPKKSLYSNQKPDAGKLQMDFLKMLTTQLQNQDPLKPVENTEFTSQMAQFTALSEQQTSNDLLRQLLSAQTTSQVNQAVSYMGKQVVVKGDMTNAAHGQAIVRFNMPEAGAAAINIYDESGKLVKSLDAQQFKAGDQNHLIKDDTLPDGRYRFSVALLGDESSTAITTYEAGEVTGVVNDATAGVTLELNGHTVAMADVRRVEQM